MKVDMKRKLVASLISNKIYLKIKTVKKKDKKEQCIMIKGSIQEESIIFINIYVPNIESP